MIYNADLHVHIGSTIDGSPIKITASKQLTILNILEESLKKGLDIVGIIDSASPKVINEINFHIDNGTLVPIKGGGLKYKNKLTLILGSEIEIGKDEKGSPHLLAYFKTIEDINQFSNIIKKSIKNINLSSQRCRLNSIEVLKIVSMLGGFVIPAHIFTPFKSYYGSSSNRLINIFKDSYEKFWGVELGLSSDTNMADTIAELKEKTFLSNSDAHSIAKIAREFNAFEIEESNFDEILLAIKRLNGRKIIKNYGLNPMLGKYHRTFCTECGLILQGVTEIEKCPQCGSKKIIIGVKDRIDKIKDYDTIHPTFRPPYIYQIPLEYIPGIGKKTIQKLLNEVGSEIYVLHQADFDELKSAVGEKIARNIIDLREGKFIISSGGGGIYGKIKQ